ncbi:MAG TPA: glycine cleavage T C-terminal barrel domain-containing protein [Chthoniobacterales bacterium]|jgi:folate-binding protein YgfZ|nr:glycine cleavage T C-terminal barrel domain-containing protein [Chthoniobacterales bacterium]
MTAVTRSERPVFFDLSTRVKLRVTGGDAFRFLNGQVTNNLAKASASAAIQASILNAKGKLCAHIFLSKENDETFLLDADAELREELPVRLDRYIIADDVQIEDVTDKFSIFHFLDQAAPTLSGPTRTIAANRFGAAGWDVWSASDAAREIRRQSADDFDFCDEICAEVRRIEEGIPRWGHELTGEIIPIEANLEESAIDYAKGCYIGQEVVSRMKMSGQRNKSLCGLVSLSGVSLQSGVRLFSEADPEKEIGWITSATRSARLEKEIALGYVKRGYNSEGNRLKAAGNPVQVTALPFV